jgi:GAF domain-containing protein
VSAVFNRISYDDKPRFYAELISELEGLYEPYWFTNLANTSAALMAHLPDLNWVGFYLMKDKELRLGPFQGLPACLRIALGHGVCGTAALERRPIRVDDVDLFPGHIVCDRRSRSEIVVPLLMGEHLIGVLDVDSPHVKRFDEDDQVGLVKVVHTLMKSTPWHDSGLGN